MDRGTLVDPNGSWPDVHNRDLDLSLASPSDVEKMTKPMGCSFGRFCGQQTAMDVLDESFEKVDEIGQTEA